MAWASAAGWVHRSSWRRGLLVLGSAALMPLLGCSDAEKVGRAVLDEPAPGPEVKTTFLNSPAGEPAKPLVPTYVSIEILTAPDRAAVIAAATTAFGANAHSIADAEPKGPVVLVSVGDATRLKRDAVAALRASGARGNLLFWYPISVVRDRLIDGGTRGLWDGVLAVRNAVPGIGELGGTPRAHAFAVSTVDRPLVGDWPKPTAAGEHAGFRGPDGQQVVFLTTEVVIGSPGFEADLERLNAVRNQGGTVWVVLALPLSEPHVPTRFAP